MERCLACEAVVSKDMALYKSSPPAVLYRLPIQGSNVVPTSAVQIPDRMEQYRA
jgi:hypothetical protein